MKGQQAAELDHFCDCSFEKLQIKRASLVNLPACVRSMDLTSLKIENAPLVKLPDGILSLKRLEELSFKHTALPFLPEEINQLKSLRRLDLRGTEINSLPEGLDHLEKIDLRFTKINKSDQKAIRNQYPQVKIFFSSPCNCK
ncbi:hypothetical protein O3Q51_04435 [Cryomorphaceae bacterium 1068]|nr:hypothetical protein [Cryomorphaceae bacterium 1068]